MSGFYLDLRHECLHESQAATSQLVGRSWSFPYAAVRDDHEDAAFVLHSFHGDLTAEFGVLDRVCSRFVSREDDVITYRFRHAHPLEPRSELPPKRA